MKEFHNIFFWKFIKLLKVWTVKKYIDKILSKIRGSCSTKIDALKFVLKNDSQKSWEKVTWI